ncbi:BREX system P-loop protein BrxC [Aeribacillus sp. FSL K6-1121]|uniref:BREX system P-loop protein BrxC n=1 Tax=Aeribacillus sp. FSL K6-1121 TaxID=2954745 RepID=UPI0030FBA233
MTKIHTIFRDKITRDINPVVKVQDQNKEHIRQELQEYVITEQIRGHFKKAFENYLNGSKYCYWISGWFGSGKSHFTKLFGHVLGDYEFENTTSSEIFLSRDESSVLRPLVEEIREKYRTEVLMFDILEETSYDSNNQQQSISITIYKQFLSYLGFYSHILWVGELEYDLYDQGIYDEFKIEYEKLSGKSWLEAREKPARQKSKIAKTLSKIKSDDFPSETIALDYINSIQTDFSMSPKRLIEVLKSYIEKKQNNLDKELRFLLLIDEMGQFIARDDQKISELQGISHQVDVTGKGKIWLGVTAQEKLEAVVEDAIKYNDELGKIADRFEIKIHLTPENLDDVLYERVLKKTSEGRNTLEDEYERFSGKLESILDFSDADRKFPEITKEYFVKAYPFIPYQLGIIKDIFIKFLQRTESNKKLGGTNRSMIKTTQGILTNPENQFDKMEIGYFVTLDQVYAEARASDFVPSTVIDTVEEVEKADPENHEFTKKVLKVLYLLDSISYLPRTLDNITKLLFNHIEVNFHDLRTKVENSLKKLTKTGFVEREGEIYSFLTPEEQSFREIVLAEQEEVRTRAISIYVKDLVKELFNQNRTQYKQISLFSVDMYADEEKYANGKDISFEALSPVILSNDETLRGKKRKESINDESRIYWLAEPNEEIEEFIREYLARQAAINNQREKADEEKLFFLRKEEQKNQNLSLEIKRKIKSSFLSGSYLYRGKEFDLPKGEEIKPIFDELIGIVIPVVYTRFDDVSVKITSSQIDEVFKPSLYSTSAVFKELNILDKDNQINQSAKVLNEVLTEIKSRNARFGVCTGNDLLELFSNRPYGWDSLAIRFFSALLFRGGFIELEVKGKPIRSYTESGVKEIFEKEPNFKTAQLIEVKNVDPAIRQQCKRILEANFNETVEADTIPEYYQKAIKISNKLLRQVQGLIVSARDNDLPIINSLEKIETEYDKVINKNHSSDVVISFVDVYQQLTDEMNLMSKFDKFISNENINVLKEIKKFIFEIWEPQQFPKDDSLEKLVLFIKSQLQTVEFLDNWSDIKGRYLEIKTYYDSVFLDIHQTVMKNIEQMMNEIENLPQFHLFDVFEQRRILEPLSKYYEDSASKSKYNYDFLEQLKNALPSYKQKAIAIYGDLLKELNRSVNTTIEDEENNDNPKPVFKQIRLSDFMKMRQISSDKEIEEFVKELEEKLKEELRKVDYFILS